MIQIMLDPSVEKQSKQFQSVKAKIAKSQENFVVSDDAEIKGLPWSVLKHDVLKPEFDFYKFWVSHPNLC